MSRGQTVTMYQVYDSGASATIHNPDDVDIYLDDLKDLNREHFVVLGMSTKNAVLFREVIAIGSLNACVVHPREVFRPAIAFEAGCHSIIVAHNHPSGNRSPSDCDKDLMKRLKEGVELLGIALLDSIIVSREGSLSMQAEGLL